jgi:hypothetical protein
MMGIAVEENRASSKMTIVLEDIVVIVGNAGKLSFIEVENVWIWRAKFK